MRIEAGTSEAMKYDKVLIDGVENPVVRWVDTEKRQYGVYEQNPHICIKQAVAINLDPAGRVIEITTIIK